MSVQGNLSSTSLPPAISNALASPRHSVSGENPKAKTNSKTAALQTDTGIYIKVVLNYSIYQCIFDMLYFLHFIRIIIQVPAFGSNLLTPLEMYQHSINCF